MEQNVLLPFENDLDLPSILNDRVLDRKFTLDHPEVLEWTKFFYKRANVEKIFKEITENPLFSSEISAHVVGKMWHSFSEFMPKYLCSSAAKVNSNEIRHYIAQVAFEELGSRNIDHLHSKLFYNCLEMANVPDGISEIFNAEVPLEFLWQELQKTESTEKILGISLGLEMPAVENIETIFNSLAHNSDVSEKLSKSLFFRIHRVNEEEHIRLNVANFLRFCPSEDQKVNFISGFDVAIKFWNNFWSNANGEIKQQ